MKHNIAIGRNNVLSGSVSPIGLVTPEFIGQDYTDMNKGILYKANGLTNNNWMEIKGGGDNTIPKKIVRESKDNMGMYTVVKEFNEEGLLSRKSTISNLSDLNLYQDQKIEYYEDGVLLKVEEFTLLYDQDGKFISSERKEG